MKQLNEIKRMQQLAGLIKENDNGIPTIVKAERHPIPLLNARGIVILTLSNGEKVNLRGGDLEGIYGGDSNDLDQYVGEKWDQDPYNSEPKPTQQDINDETAADQFDPNR